MAKDLFYSLDLNLLRTFLVLSQELNMRKASQRLFVSQPAISQALQKLRNHFDDELFMKVPTGLEATPFAEELAVAITPHLDGLASALNHSNHFDPLEIDYPIRIAVSPVVLTCLSGALYQRIRQQAPNSTLELIGWNESTLEEIQKGQTLVGIGYDIDAVNNISRAKLVELTGQIIVRKDHPITKDTVCAEDMVGYDIASVMTPGWNDNFSLAQQIMHRAGYEAKVGFRSEFVLAAVDIIQHTDMYMPHSNLFPIKHYPQLKALNALVNGNTVQYPVLAYYHTKHRQSPMIHWLNDLIETVLLEQIN
ncbi:LysR family transcriptional regulator [Vibrio sinaloensis]|uniref:LysR family transcriptional regulator n=1 Tax=Photobacterium sp. (strain ATCC 43367) TaxID=379097 RepID=UPI00057E2A70|nr:LysR family transcriptional regulator [Vibrio sinaloensis]KIE22242.1 LysR family transcriptional regulator [Vibrio sinaloensis]